MRVTLSTLIYILSILLEFVFHLSSNIQHIICFLLVIMTIISSYFCLVNITQDLFSHDISKSSIFLIIQEEYEIILISTSVSNYFLKLSIEHKLIVLQRHLYSNRQKKANGCIGFFQRVTNEGLRNDTSVSGEKVRLRLHLHLRKDICYLNFS